MVLAFILGVARFLSLLAEASRLSIAIGITALQVLVATVVGTCTRSRVADAASAIASALGKAIGQINAIKPSVTGGTWRDGDTNTVEQLASVGNVGFKLTVEERVEEKVKINENTTCHGGLVLCQCEVYGLNLRQSLR